ncbi:hypothetical protein DMENIID0001_169910 [Sergentomyia squamirostris]
MESERNSQDFEVAAVTESAPSPHYHRIQQPPPPPPSDVMPYLRHPGKLHPPTPSYYPHRHAEEKTLLEIKEIVSAFSSMPTEFLNSWLRPVTSTTVIQVPQAAPPAPVEPISTMAVPIQTVQTTNTLFPGGLSFRLRKTLDITWSTMHAEKNFTTLKSYLISAIWTGVIVDATTSRQDFEIDHEALPDEEFENVRKYFYR